MAAFGPLLPGNDSSQPLPLILTVAMALAGAYTRLAVGRRVHVERVQLTG
ncbi:hypothetical protein [Kosakonia cowanii]|nr:hypothetical protein [Kosakonia cowanii]